MQARFTLFAHGAGLGTASPWMQGWARRLASLGPVEPFDYPYMAAGRRAPDRLPRLIEAHTAALARAGTAHGGPALLVGKSMGSRVGCHVATAPDLPCPVAAVVCLGYPLLSARGAVRDEVLLALPVPVLFVQGTRDPMCPLDRLNEVRARMTAPSALLAVEGGDHSLLLSKTALRTAEATQDAVDDRILAAIANFARSPKDAA